MDYKKRAQALRAIGHSPFVLRNENTQDLDALLLDEQGRLRVLPADELRTMNEGRMRLWCHKNAVYLIPSQELVAWIKDRIKGRTAIEIGAGNGALGRTLGIPMYDNFMQQDFPDVVACYEAARQPRVRYGADVIKRNANAAVRVKRPQVVIGSWITHLYKADEPGRGGNVYGIDELKILDHVETYIHVGCQRVHGQKRWRPTEEHQPDWLFGRGRDRVIYVWERSQPERAVLQAVL